MSNFNKVILMGNLTRDPEIRFTQGAMAAEAVARAIRNAALAARALDDPALPAARDWPGR